MVARAEIGRQAERLRRMKPSPAGVRWEHDWPGCPVEVLVELKAAIARLGARG